MTTFNPQITVGELVKERPARSRIFEQLKIDYCCGGKIPLAQACENKNLDVNQVLEQLMKVDQQDNALVDADAMG
jgi:regulator of cell morphogenesis and NO signaling